jgi:hypothetical protein
MMRPLPISMVVPSGKEKGEMKLRGMFRVILKRTNKCNHIPSGAAKGRIFASRQAGA